MPSSLPPRRRVSIGVVLWLALLATATGCAGTTRIETILDDPSAFDGRDVRIEGAVTQALGVPGVGGTYALNDGTGTLRVLTEAGGVPREGAEVSVVGTFRALFVIGTETVAVLEERDRDVR